jgi:hypothetical protein
MFKRVAIHVIDNHARLVSGIKSLIIKQDDQEQDLCEFRNIFMSFLKLNLNSY